MDGRTGSLQIHEGSLVKANDTTFLVDINQMTPIDVSFSVPEGELPGLSRAMKQSRRLRVEAVIPGDESAPLSGELTFIGNEVDRNTGTLRLKATFPNEKERLWPGLFVNVSLILSVQPDALLIPSQAVQAGQQGPYVFVIKPDLRVESRLVTPDGTGTE